MYFQSSHYFLVYHSVFSHSINVYYMYERIGAKIASKKYNTLGGTYYEIHAY